MSNLPRRPPWWLVSFLPLALLGCKSAESSASTNVVEAASPAVDEITRAEALEAFDTAWQAVFDYHFDEDFNGVDWVAVKEELRPRAAEAKTSSELDGIIRDMLGRLGQSHFALMKSTTLPDAVASTAGRPPEELAGGLGLEFRLRDEGLLVSKVYAESPADKAGIRTGWILRKVGDKNFVDLVAGMKQGNEDRPRSVAFGAQRVAESECHGRIGSAVDMTLVDGEDEEVTLTLERAERDVIAHSFGTSLPTFYLRYEQETLERDGKEVGRIRFTNWFVPMMKPIDAAIDEMRGYDGIIIDLRGNGGGAGAMVMGVAGHFFEDKRELGVQKMRGAQLNYVANPRLTNAAGELVDPYSGPVAILIDETSASASEVFAGGMQSTGRVRVFGEISAGAVLPARMTKLPNGDSILHAVGDFTTSDGKLLEGVGVVPDQVVLLRRADLLAGKDAILDVAIDWIVAQ
jgi:carboxyl-terminal processing protease